MVGKHIHELKIGDKAEFGKTITEGDIGLFAGISGDINPAHINEVYASQTFFKGRIAHGMLYASFISAVIANRLPGPGTIYISQSLTFTAPVKIGDTVTAQVEVAEIDMEKKRVKLITTCVNQHGKKVIIGEAVVSPPKG